MFSSTTVVLRWRHAKFKNRRATACALNTDSVLLFRVTQGKLWQYCTGLRYAPPRFGSVGIVPVKGQQAVQLYRALGEAFPQQIDPSRNKSTEEVRARGTQETTPSSSLSLTI